MFAFFKSRLKVIFRGIMRAENVKSEWREIIWKKSFKWKQQSWEDFFSLLRPAKGQKKRVDKVVAILIVFIHILILMRAHPGVSH